MLKNYLTLALKVLKRKPFYTFISLFGISFTLMILMLVVAMGDAMIGNNPPMTHGDRLVVVPMVERYTEIYDTIRPIDTVMLEGGGVRYDTSEVLNKTNSRFMASGRMSPAFAQKNLLALDGVEAASVFSAGNTIDGYLDGRKVSFDAYYTDADYWRVFDYNFTHGEAYRPEDVTAGRRVAVLTDYAAREYFGSASANVLGREVTLGDERYQVKGIIASPLQEDDLTGGGIFLPYTTAAPQMLGGGTDIMGSFATVYLATSQAARAKVTEQLNYIGEQYEMPPDSDFEQLRVYSGTRLQYFATEALSSNDAEEAVWLLFIPLAVLLSLFIFLPLINLINLNISRVHERQSEIAVRKAFGADSRDVLQQFLFENLVLTCIGGAIGLVLAYMAVQYINGAELLGRSRLSFSSVVFLSSLLLIALFGLLSGLLPAYRMSRTNIAQSLR